MKMRFVAHFSHPEIKMRRDDGRKKVDERSFSLLLLRFFFLCYSFSGTDQHETIDEDSCCWHEAHKEIQGKLIQHAPDGVYLSCWKRERLIIENKSSRGRGGWGEPRERNLSNRCLNQHLKMQKACVDVALKKGRKKNKPAKAEWKQTRESCSSLSYWSVLFYLFWCIVKSKKRIESQMDHCKSQEQRKRKTDKNEDKNAHTEINQKLEFVRSKQFFSFRFSSSSFILSIRFLQNRCRFLIPRLVLDQEDWNRSCELYTDKETRKKQRWKTTKPRHSHKENQTKFQRITDLLQRNCEHCSTTQVLTWTKRQEKSQDGKQILSVRQRLHDCSTNHWDPDQEECTRFYARKEWHNSKQKVQAE